MKIIADENMPNVISLFSGLGDVTLVNGRSLTNEQLMEADILLVRSVTKVNETLLKGTPVKYVGSATIGTDHIDTDYLISQGIGFNSAPGCNADAVADYVFSALSYLFMTKGVHWLGARIGVIGQGNVGRCVASRFVALGCDVVAYDPFLSKSVPGVSLTSLKEVMDSDVICLHAPLTKTGPYPSFDMINDEYVSKLKTGQTIISAGRGGVINEQALIKQFHALDGALNLAIDVWHGEPHPNMELASLCDIATPHIAGYSKQGREKGTWYIYQSVCQFFDTAPKSSFAEAISQGSICELKLNSSLARDEALARAIQSVFDVARDSSRFKHVMSSGTDKGFDWLRKNYVERDEFNTTLVKHSKFSNDLQALGFHQ